MSVLLRRRGVLAAGRGLALSAFDSFDRANHASSLGTADSGHTWSTLSGTWGINNNQAYHPDQGAGVVGVAVIDAGAGAENGRVKVKMPAMTGSIAGNYGIAFRVLNANNFWRLALDQNNGRLYLIKTVSGTGTVVVNELVTVTNGDEIEVVFDGDSISAFHNGVQVGATITDSFNNGRTWHGLARANHTGGSAKGDARWDDFEAWK